MNGLIVKVATGEPMQPLTNAVVNAPQYTILCAQEPRCKERIELLLTRLESSTETSAAQNVSYILNACISTTTLTPDFVESFVEKILALALGHPQWADLIAWTCAVCHYYCTDEITVSIFSEFEAPVVAARGLRDHAQNRELCLAACALLSHFNMYDSGDGIAQLINALRLHKADAQVCALITRSLAEFTSYFKENPDRFVKACEEFVEAGGCGALEEALDEQSSMEDIVVHAARITANVVSSGVPAAWDPESDMIMLLASVLQRNKGTDTLCGNILRVFSHVPTSSHIDWNVISDLFKSSNAELVVLECLHFFSSVAMNAKEAKPNIASHGCVPRVLEVMKQHQGNANIQEEACSLLSYLSFDSETITSTITDSGGIVLVLNAMQRFPRNEDLLMCACAALSGLTFNNQAGQQVIIDHNGIGLILDAMRNGHKARLEENGCLAIGTMCWNSELKADVVRLGGVQVIMKALSVHYMSSGLVKNACRALAQVAFNCEKYRDDMSARGVIPLIVRGMEQHPNYDRAQMHGCVALSYLSWTNEENAAQITQHGGYKVIINAMRNHPTNHEVQEHACRALANISSVPLEDAAAALEQIVAAMRRHEFVSEVQEEACRALVTLSLVSPANKDKLYQLDAASVVIAAMKNFPRAQLVQQEACNALAHLAYEHADLDKAVTDLRGVALLLTAMRTHRNCPKVQLNACGGLSALAFDNPVAQQQIYELGGVQCVIHAMDNFERLRMLELGCSVLGTLAWNIDIKEKVAVEAIPEILKAMRIHEMSPLLQKSTCRAISQFAFNSESNRQLLADSGAIPLIVNAMRLHLSTEKLIVHALKALTYLCWENTRVAETIIAEDVEGVIQKVVQRYANNQRVFNEAVHLSKILFRKTTGSPSPGTRVMSPPQASPQSLLYTPGPIRRMYDDQRPPSPPPQDDVEDSRHFYVTAMDDINEEGPSSQTMARARHVDPGMHGEDNRGGGGGRGRYYGNGGGGSGGSGPRGGPMRGGARGQGAHPRGRGAVFRQVATDGTVVEVSEEAMAARFGRRPPPPGARPPRRGGRGASGGMGGSGGAVSGGGGGSGGAPYARRGEDPWDDPDPDSFHGNRGMGEMNWQQAQLAAAGSTGAGAEGTSAVPSQTTWGRGGGLPAPRSANTAPGQYKGSAPHPYRGGTGARGRSGGRGGTSG